LSCQDWRWFSWRLCRWFLIWFGFDRSSIGGTVKCNLDEAKNM